MVSRDMEWVCGACGMVNTVKKGGDMAFYNIVRWSSKKRVEYESLGQGWKARDEQLGVLLKKEMGLK